GAATVAPGIGATAQPVAGAADDAVTCGSGRAAGAACAAGAPPWGGPCGAGPDPPGPLSPGMCLATKRTRMLKTFSIASRRSALGPDPSAARVLNCARSPGFVNARRTMSSFTPAGD